MSSEILCGKYQDFHSWYRSLYRILVGLLALTRRTSDASAIFEDGNNPLMQPYCIGDTEIFKPKCMKSEVIVMMGALYGRMEMSRCLFDEGDNRDMLLQASNNPQFLGCSADVLHILDAKCSGRNNCMVSGIEPSLRKTKPCWSALKNYLLAGYKCVRVIEVDRSCSVSVTSSVQYLMSDRSSETKLSCGSRHQPWKLEAPAGQQINVSLLDFRTKDETVECKAIGYILDESGNRNATICNHLNERKVSIYRSSSNIASLMLNQVMNLNESGGSFLIGVVAVGCSDVLAPVDSWMRRMDDEAVVGCYTSRQTWRLRCVNNQWRGVIGNCTREIGIVLKDTTPVENEHHMRNSNEVVVMVVIAALSMVICTIIICTASVCLRRYYAITLRKQQSRGHQPFAESTGQHFQGFQNEKEKSALSPILIQT